MKSGWKTSEFWVAMIGQLLAFGVTLGVISQSAQADATATVGNVVAAVFTIIAAAASAWKYIHSRTELKSLESEVNSDSWTVNEPSPNQKPPQGGSSTAPLRTVLPVILLALVLLPGLAHCQTTPACFRNRQPQGPRPTDPALLAALSQIAANQQQMLLLMAQRQQQAPTPAPVSPAPAAPVAPHIYYITPPAPSFPQYLDPRGAPIQQLDPRGQPPVQQLDPRGQPPVQQLSPQGSPIQPLTPQGQIVQPLSPQGSPIQPLTPQSAPVQPLLPQAGPPGAGKGLQQLTPGNWKPLAPDPGAIKPGTVVYTPALASVQRRPIYPERK